MLELGEGAGECVIKDGHVCVCVCILHIFDRTLSAVSLHRFPLRLVLLA